LDTTDLSFALSVAEDVVDLVDILEVGTLLTYQHGMRAVQAVRDRFPSSYVVADLKVMDCGAAVARMALEAGANALIVQAAAPRDTLVAATATAASYRGSVIVDSLGIYEADQVRDRIQGIDVAGVILHIGKDEQISGRKSLADLVERIAEAPGLPPIGVAGGISADDVHALASVAGLHSIVIGEAIMASSMPRVVAARIYTICEEGGIEPA
jgi:3-keto-L-gulonate-6-phosphate decarboxylase